MRTSSRYLGYCLVLASSVAFAAPPASKNPNRIEPPPPPGLNDPGVETPATPADPAAPPDAGKSDNDPLAPLPKPDTRPVRDKGSRDAAANSERIAQSQMTSRQQGTDT